MVRKQKAAEAVPPAPPSPRRTRAAAAAKPPAPAVPRAQDPDTEPDEASGEGDDEHDVVSSPAKKQKSRAKKQPAKKSGKKSSSGENAPKHARNAARGRKSEVFVELPATPTAHRARMQESISGSGVADRDMPPSSPPLAPPSSPVNEQSSVFHRVPRSSPGPRPLFPPELVRKARERAQGMLARADAQIAATRVAQRPPDREEAPQDTELTADEENEANSGSDYEEGVAE
ncbi:hypothetical protein PLICRDRAFT_30201, partial [Plicaturopsis crispa FD-325 SS-3]